MNELVVLVIEQQGSLTVFTVDCVLLSEFNIDVAL